jgi:hypothetical protein
MANGVLGRLLRINFPFWKKSQKSFARSRSFNGKTACKSMERKQNQEKHRAIKPMRLQDAECRLNKRLYHWAKATMTREVAEGFPLLHACQYNRRVKCFLEWMQDTSEDQQLPRCLALVQRSFGLHLDPTISTPQTEAVFLEYHNACAQYHDALPPVPDCDKNAPGFVKADPLRTLESITHELTPLCGKPKKRSKYKREFVRSFADWTFSTHVQIWLKDETVHAYGFLRRSDSEPRKLGGLWPSRIDPLMLLGVSGSDFPLVGQTHEILCVQSLRASIEMFVLSIPKLVEALGANP